MKKKKTVTMKQTIPMSEAPPPDASVETAPDTSVSIPPDKSVGGTDLKSVPNNSPDTFSHADEGFPIIGIGASAGGLAAFEAFFSAMPADTNPGMAFVLVQHLAPDHKSILAELVRRYTRMQVFEVEDGMAVRPNCTYIIPPNRDMAFLNGALCQEQIDLSGLLAKELSAFLFYDEPWFRTGAERRTNASLTQAEELSIVHLPQLLRSMAEDGCG